MLALVLVIQAGLASGGKQARLTPTVSRVGGEFGREKTRMKGPVQLVCSNCGERFTIGADSHLVTDEDLLEYLKDGGASAVIHIGTYTRKPDLAQHVTLQENQKSENLRKLDTIMADLAQGERRAWYCDACKRTNEYPPEWLRGPRKDLHPPIASPKCDVCSNAVQPGQGYTLSTTEVTSETNYWKFYFLNYPAQVKQLGNKGEKLLSLVIQRCADPGAWLVCEDCVTMFSVDKAKAKQLCQEQWKRNDTFAPRFLGPAAWEAALKRAGDGWKNAFAREPNIDREEESVRLMLAVYASSVAKWKKGDSESSLIVIDGPSLAENRNQEPKESQKRWWQFWR